MVQCENEHENNLNDNQFFKRSNKENFRFTYCNNVHEAFVQKMHVLKLNPLEYDVITK